MYPYLNMVLYINSDTMCSIWGGFLGLASILDFQHCTDEAQKAETVLSAVS